MKAKIAKMTKAVLIVKRNEGKGYNQNEAGTGILLSINIVRNNRKHFKIKIFE